MPDDDIADAPTRPRRGLVRRVVKLAVPIGFLAIAAWSIVGALAEGAPRSRPGGDATKEQHATTEVTIAAVGDIGSDERGRATLNRMASADPDVYLALGDLSYAGPGSEQEWCSLVRSTIGWVVPFEIVAGNHEEDTGEDGRIAAFAECLADRMNAVGDYGIQYFFDVGRLARIIMISPDLTIEGTHYYYGDGNANIQWLEDTIDDARRSGIQWVVVGMHKNCLSVGENYCSVYQDLLSLLVEKRVDLVLHGHEHTYQRSKQLAVRREGCAAVLVDAFDPHCVADHGADDEYVKGAGPVFVVSGTGGGELYEVDQDDPEAGYFAATMGAGPESRHGFTSVRLTPSELAVRFVGSTPGSFGDGFHVVASRPVR